MNKVFIKLNGTGNIPNGNSSRNAISAKLFFGMDGAKSYCAKVDFIQYAKSLRELEVEQLDQTITCMRQGLRTSGTLTTRKDKGLREYYYLNFIKLNATVGTKVILGAGMKQFIADYQDGLISVDFTLEELVEEALNS